MKLIIHIDGGSRGNPGPAAAGVVIHRSGKTTPVWEAGYFLGKATNNVAEYTGLIRATEKAAELGASEVQIHSDSELMVRQIVGQYRVKSSDLKPLFEQAQMNLLRLGQWQIKHVRREQNKRADELVNRALDRQADVIESDTGAQPESDAPPPAKAKPAPAATTRPSREALGDAPRFTARLAYEPGPDCPAELKGGRTYRFGPRIPAGFCVFATATLLQEGPEAVCSGQRTCQRCGTTIEVERLDPSGSESGANP